jgi:hypothetical protein
MNIDTSDDKLQGKSQSSSWNRERNEHRGDDCKNESEELGRVEEELNVMLDDHSTSGGPLRDGTATATTINSGKSSSSNVTGTSQGQPEVHKISLSTNSEGKSLVSGPHDTFPGKKTEVETQVSNDDALNPHSLMPSPLLAQSDAAIRSSAAEDSAAMPSLALQRPLTFFCHPETLENWDACVSTMLELRLSKNSTYDVDALKKSWKLLQTVPRLSCILGNNYRETFKTMSRESYDVQSSIAILEAKIEMSLARDQLYRAKDRLTDVNWILKTMASLSQSSSSMSSKSATETCSDDSSFDDYDDDDHDFLAQVCLRPEDDKRPRQIRPLISIGQRLLTSLDHLGVHRSCVEMFNARYQHMLESALMNPDYLKSSVDLTLSDRHEYLKQMATALQGKPSSTLLDQQIVSAIAQCVPAPRSNEVGVVQPYLVSFLHALGSCLDDNNQFQQQAKPNEQCTAGETLENRPRRCVKEQDHVRIADGLVAVDGRFISLLCDDSMEIRVEMKTEMRASKTNPMHQIHIGCDQVYSHLARHLRVLFNFCGAGVDGKATGVVIMPSCVKIIQLCLEKMGTKEMTLTGYESDPLPLMTVENFGLWAKLEGISQKKLNILKNVLFPSNTKQEDIPPIGSASNKDIPSGIVALANILISKGSDLFGTGNIENDSIGTLLDHGGFSCTYTNKHNVDSVVKVSRYGLKAALEREAGVLIALKNSMVGNKNNAGIVCLLSHENLVVRFGDVERILSANILSPRGLLLERVLSTDPKERRQQLLYCGGVLKSALDYLHGHQYTHNDITPSSIMFKVGQPGRPFLTDFGAATEMGKLVLCEFNATAPYAHSDILQKHQSIVLWCGQPMYDFAGLAFSMATLVSFDTRRPWTCFCPGDLAANNDSTPLQLQWSEFVEWVGFRSDTAQKLLEEANFHAEWLNWCNDKIIGKENDIGNEVELMTAMGTG